MRERGRCSAGGEGGDARVFIGSRATSGELASVTLFDHGFQGGDFLPQTVLARGKAEQIADMQNPNEPIGYEYAK